ncbi:sigma-70 family RNA polymerase sigma factor [Thalassospiraceae bacterium LMO-SO8]|nr:sigma-70 family RNA polymerase sigma factor [Alphaproteobacteria bacterium LMO-S08]WND74887.1 sigma-70 family RNA polymerase sigma factor [Thalassospiraceae bacterium LMO-SO8]
MTERRIMQAIEDQIPDLYRYARFLEATPDRADDLLQDCLERGVSRLDRFQAGTDLRAWLFAIMHNLFIDRARRRQRRGPHVPVEDWLAETHQPPDQIDRLRLKDLDRALAALKPRDRWILHLVVIEGKRYRDVARELNIAVGTVKSGLSRARRVLARAA